MSTFSTLFKAGVRSLVVTGPVNTFKIIASTIGDITFDWFHGTDTYKGLDVRKVNANLNNAEHVTIYGPTRSKPFMSLLKKLNLNKSSVFIDFGSGKGRVLMLVQKYGIKKAIGVELSPELCEIAKSNLQKVAPNFDYQIIQSDMMKYKVTTGDIFYFYDPCSKEVMKSCCQNILDYIQAKKKKITIIYHSNSVRGEDIFVDFEDFVSSVHYISGNRFYILEN